MAGEKPTFLLFQKIGQLQGWEFLIVTGLWSFFIGLVILLIAKMLRLFDLDDRIITFVKQVGNHMMRSKLEGFKAKFEEDESSCKR